MVFSRASQPADECLSAWAAEVLSGGSAATVLELVPGEARFEAIKGPERWGDFGAAVRDPVDGTRGVLIDQYAAAGGGAPTPARRRAGGRRPPPAAPGRVRSPGRRGRVHDAAAGCANHAPHRAHRPGGDGRLGRAG